MLVTIVEHGVTPSVTAARLTYAAAPDSIQGATASGLLGASGSLLDSMQEVAMVQTGVDRVDEETSLESVAESIVDERDTLPGFGNLSHEPTDPRTDTLFSMLEAEGLDGDPLAIIREIQPVAESEYGTNLLTNATGAIGTVASELGLDSGRRTAASRS